LFIVKRRDGVSAWFWHDRAMIFTLMPDGGRAGLVQDLSDLGALDAIRLEHGADFVCFSSRDG
jgi:hypothetical protein